MCLENFERFEKVSKSNPIIGYRTWKFPIKDLDDKSLRSLYNAYKWKKNNGPVEVLNNDSGFYSYNNNYYYNNNNYYYNNNNYYNKNNNYYNNNNYYSYYNNNYYNYNNNNNYNNYYNNYNNNNYKIHGIIHQYGKVAIHSFGYRSQYASIDTIFNIRRSDAKGSKEFLNWIDLFNNQIQKLAEKYSCKVISFQDWKESNG